MVCHTIGHTWSIFPMVCHAMKGCMPTVSPPWEVAHSPLGQTGLHSSSSSSSSAMLLATHRVNSLWRIGAETLRNCCNYAFPCLSSVMLPVICGVYSHRHPIGQMQRIFSFTGIRLVKYREYSHSQASDWSITENILIHRHATGHLQSIFSSALVFKVFRV
jgi:hypothetical protein